MFAHLEKTSRPDHYPFAAAAGSADRADRRPHTATSPLVPIVVAEGTDPVPRHIAFAPFVGFSKEVRRTDFLVERPPREVLDRAETHLWLRGFSASLSERTDTAALFARTRAPRRGVLKTLLNALVGAALTPVQEMRLLASEAGEGRTRLTVLESRQGEGSEEWAHAETELERWVVEELGGTGWPLEFPRNG